MELLYANPFFHLSADKDKAFIQVLVPGFSIKDFEVVMKDTPRLQLTKFAVLQKSLAQGAAEPTEIGLLRPLIEVSVTRDFMEASIKLNMTWEQLEQHKAALTTDIVESLRINGVVEGILFDVLSGELPLQQKLIVAKGIVPEQGCDAEVKYFTLSERKPSIREDGSADYYEMNFIDEVKAGEWLGEKIPATEGKPGRNLSGGILPAPRGRDEPLHYDKASIMEVEENGKLVLRAKKAGAVHKLGKNIAVEEIMVIRGDVGSMTGNLEFDGSIQIHGTVLDGYSVKATKDISILSELGIGAVSHIVSTNGDVFIKGGVFGKEKAVIHAGRAVYLKHAKDCQIEANDNIHIGLYAINCNLKSQYISLDKKKGRLIGGSVQAKVRLVTAYIGTESERPTKVLVEGFDRNQVMKQLEGILKDYKGVLDELERMRKEVDIYNEYAKTLSDSQKKEYMELLGRYERTTEILAELEEKRKQLMTYMSTKGDGEVYVLEKAFPRTMLQIKEIERKIEKITAGSFYVEKNNFFHC